MENGDEEIYDANEDDAFDDFVDGIDDDNM